MLYAWIHDHNAHTYLRGYWSPLWWNKGKQFIFIQVTAIFFKLMMVGKMKKWRWNNNQIWYTTRMEITVLITVYMYSLLSVTIHSMSIDLKICVDNCYLCTKHAISWKFVGTVQNGTNEFYDNLNLLKKSWNWYNFVNCPM